MRVRSNRIRAMHVGRQWWDPMNRVTTSKVGRNKRSAVPAFGVSWLHDATANRRRETACRNCAALVPAYTSTNRRRETTCRNCAALVPAYTSTHRRTGVVKLRAGTALRLFRPTHLPGDSIGRVASGVPCVATGRGRPRRRCRSLAAERSYGSGRREKLAGLRWTDVAKRQRDAAGGVPAIRESGVQAWKTTEAR